MQIIMITAKQVSDIINKKLHGTDLFLVEVIVRKGNFITVFIDSDTSVSIANCADVSRYVESKLDREKEDFELEVSSAGLDHPIRLHRQFLKNIGNDLKITTHDGKSYTALLLGAGEKELTLLMPENKKKKLPEQELTVATKDIKEARLIIKINSK